MQMMVKKLLIEAELAMLPESKIDRGGPAMMSFEEIGPDLSGAEKSFSNLKTRRRNKENKKLIELEFELDRKIKECEQTITAFEQGDRGSAHAYHQALYELPILKDQFEQVTNERCGWRSSRQFAAPIHKQYSEKSDWLEKEILRLQSQEKAHMAFLKSYPQAIKDQQQALDGLMAHIGDAHTQSPTQEQVDKVHDEILELQKKAAIAEAELPLIRDQIKNLEKELNAVGKRAKMSKEPADAKKYASPGLELADKAQHYAIRHGVSIVEATLAVMQQDLFLCDAYAVQAGMHTK
jgi:chromosome segregation ATPase